MNIADHIRNMLNTVVTEDGLSFLHLAAANDDSEFAEVLLAAGAAVNAKSNDGYTPLHMAAGKAHLKVVEALLTAGADIHARTQQDQTPLQVAAYINPSLEVIFALLAVGADIHARTQQDQIPLYITAGKAQLKVVEISLAAGAEMDAKGMHAEMMKTFLDAGADIHARTQQDQTPPSTYAAWMIVLLAAGADIHARTQQDQGPKMIEVLMSAGADIHVGTRYGTVLLHVVAQEADTGVIDVLVTPLHLVERTDNPAVTAVLSKLRCRHHLVKPIAELQLSVEEDQEN